MPSQKPFNHGRDHKGQLAGEDEGIYGGSDPAVLNIDSTENVGDDQGVHSFEVDEGFVLTADGDGGSEWTAAGGGGIEFGIYNVGNWLDIETTGDQNYHGQRLDFHGADKMTFVSDYASPGGGGDNAITLNANSGIMLLTAATDLQVTSATANVTIDAGDQIIAQADSTVTVVIGDDAGSVNRYFRIEDGAGNPLLVIDETNDSYHIKSGASWVADL